MISQENFESKFPVVVHVLNGLTIGGVESLCLQLIRHSPETTKEILLNLDPDHQDMRPEFQRIPDLSIIDFPYSPNKRFEFLWRLVFYFRKIKPQAVLIYPFGLHLFVGLAARIAGISTIEAMGQNTLPLTPEIQRKWTFIVQISKFLNIPIHPCSTAVQQSFEKVVSLPKGSSIISNACDVEGIAQRSEASHRSFQEDRHLIIGMVGRLNSIKDQATLIRAYGYLHQDHPRVELWLVGDGPERERLEQLCENLELTNSVKFLGARSDVPELLGQMDICAFSTTEEEGLPIALEEAMAASLPIVASSVSPCREVLGNGEAGLLVPPYDSHALAEALEAFILSVEKRKQWGQRAYRRAIENYSIQTCTHRWYSLLLAEEHC
jgi:glycosyltransferase involved in cell wall biosynthesis